MRSFYHGKLKKMTMQLSLQEAEKVKLETELKNNEKDSQKYSELTLQLNAKQKHIDQLKRRHAEVKALTSIASRNEAVIANLTTEIEEMKRYKSSLESQLLKERKEHAKMLQHFQKKASTQQKNATKMRLQLATTLAQKQKVQEIAKAHAEEITELRSKYKSAEKKLRMQTLKRGMMEKAGIDPVLTGHHGRRTSTKPAKTSYNRNDTRSHSSGDTHRMRNFLDDKIAEISRKEAAADKLAHEWEDHLDLTNRKEQFIAESNGKRNDITITDEIEALDFQIKYKESRIRQLASKLANKSSNDNISTSKGFSHDTLVGDRAFQSITSDLPPLAASQLASKVLFGIVVRERRRVATLARAASTLDQKALQAEKLAADREAALKSLIDETKNERVAMAQNQQEKILSLMEIVQGEGQEEETEVSAELRTSLSESVVLRLANERIETVEAQLSDLKQEKESRETYQAREAETVNELKQLTQDYSHLLETSKALRTSLLKIRDRITATSKSHDPAILTTIINIIAKTLKSISQAAKIDKENADRRNISSHYEDSDSEDYDGNEVPEWAGHIMKDLAIIAAGEVPASLRTPREGGKQRLPRTPGGSVFDRLSSPENFTTSHYERLSDNASVGSNTARSRSTSRSRHNTPSRDERSSYTPLRYRSSRSPSPMRQRSPHHSETRLTDRVSAILKDGPPRVLSSPNYPIDDDEQSFRSTGSRSVRSSGSRSARSGRRHLAAESKFVKAYTKKDVFERLQKKHTNSYILNVKASQTHDSAK
jgi:DNA repair exonuclease SbcCD ATPase subunit